MNHPYTPYSTPTVGSSGETGLWRSLKPLIDLEKCNGCLLCWLYCPEATVIRTGENGVEIDYKYCKGCGVCAKECARDAIRMVDES